MSVQQPRTAWIYIRESKDASASGHNPDNQLRLCRDLAAEKGLTVANIAVEIESAVSMSMRKRPIWRQVQRAALRHEFDALIVWEYSRIARNTSDWMYFVSRAVHADVDVFSTDPDERRIDWHTSEGRIMLAMFGGFAEMERERTRKRTMENIRMRVIKGMPLVGQKAPYGYQWITESSITDLTGAARARKVRLEPCEPEATRMRAIWDYLDDADLYHVRAPASKTQPIGFCINWLNLVQHWPAPMGGQWTKNTLRYLLQQGYYWGEGEAYRTVMVDVPVADPETGGIEPEKRQRQRPAAERIPLSVENVPPLITMEQAERVHAWLSEAQHYRRYGPVTQDGHPSKRHPRTWSEDEFLLNGRLHPLRSLRSADAPAPSS